MLVKVPSERGSAHQLRRIESVTDTALSNVELEGMLRQLLERLCDLLDADAATVLMHDADARALVPTTAVGVGDDLRTAVKVPVGKGFAGSIAAQKRAVTLDRVDKTTVVNPYLWQHRLRSLLGVPMLAEGQVVGVLHVGSKTRRRFTDDDTKLLQVAADRVALATQARISRTEHAAAQILQRSVMPSALPAIPGVELAARYIPGGKAGVGGDWYDVFTLPSGKVGIVIGDVVGEGLRAAVIMARLRSALQAYALGTSDPATVLEKLDRMVRHFEPNIMATISYAVLDLETNRMVISLAGHPPPVYAQPNRPAVLLDGKPDLPVGTQLSARARGTTELTVSPHMVMCFYTDGLVERKGVSIGAGLERLCDTMHAGAAAETACADIVDALLSGYEPIDDIAITVLNRTESPLSADVARGQPLGDQAGQHAWAGSTSHR